MDPTPPTTERTHQERPLPPCIGFVLDVVRVLLGYGRQLDAALPAQASHPRFPTLAAGFGTHDVRRILAHVQRGLLRAMMLERYLLARAAQGRDIAPVPQPAPAEPADIEALDLKLRAPAQPRVPTRRGARIERDDPMHFAIPTLKELETQVRRRSIGRTVAEICMDLGITAGICDGTFWNEIYLTLSHFGGSLERLVGVQTSRRETFRKERDKRPDTWTFEIWDRPKDAIRQLLGHILGEPGPALAPA